MNVGPFQARRWRKAGRLSSKLLRSVGRAVRSLRPTRIAAPDVPNLYLDLLEQTLTGVILEDAGYLPSWEPSEPSGYDRTLRAYGMDWPVHAQTMVGLHRLRNLRRCIADVIRDKVPGDLIETGVWRGGACIYMRANLVVHDVKDRRVWVADSFEGLPPPDLQNFPIDAPDGLHRVKLLAVSLEEVKNNFKKYNMLDDQVVFLKGFFRDTLAAAPIERLAIMRLDGDMYESTIQALALYDKLSVGGYVIIDDYALPNCRTAVDHFREARGISEPVEPIDTVSAFWRKKVERSAGPLS